MMRLHLIACKVVQREAYFCAARSENVIDVTLMPQGLHEQPDELRSELTKAVQTTHDIQGRPYDATLLGYCLCSNGIVGLSSKTTLVVPRGHDCVTLLLGSKEKYQQYFDSHRGIYWYSPGWIESEKQPSKELYESKLQEYKDKYGEDNAEYLMQTEQGWLKEYNWATYVDWPLADSEKYVQFTKNCAEYLGWQYDRIEGDPSLLQRLFDADWNDEDFLVLKPGQEIAEDLTSDRIIKAE